MSIDLAGIVILAGGESTRMGSPKALLKLANGESLIDFHIRHAKLLNVPVMVADNGKGFCQYIEVKVIGDYLANDETGKGAGALSAIASAMQNLPNQNGYLLVVSCDSLLGADVVFDLFQETFVVSLSNYDVSDSSTGSERTETYEVIYLKSEKDYPLLGLYHLDLLPKLKDYLDNANRAVMKFLKDKNVRTVNLPNEWVNLTNFNTKGDFELALSQLKQEKN